MQYNLVLFVRTAMFRLALSRLGRTAAACTANENASALAMARVSALAERIELSLVRNRAYAVNYARVQTAVQTGTLAADSLQTPAIRSSTTREQPRRVYAPYTPRLDAPVLTASLCMPKQSRLYTQANDPCGTVRLEPSYNR